MAPKDKEGCMFFRVRCPLSGSDHCRRRWCLKYIACPPDVAHAKAIYSHQTQKSVHFSIFTHLHTPSHNQLLLMLMLSMMLVLLLMLMLC